jgi:hypothetical protein
MKTGLLVAAVSLFAGGIAAAQQQPQQQAPVV